MPTTRVEEICNALVSAGIHIVEITLDSEDATRTIARLCGRGDILVAAGTVRSPADVDRAVEAGAEVCVAPSFRRASLVRSLELGVPFIPGCVTPTEIDEAWASGASLVKLFPAASLGQAYVRDLLAPLSDVSLIATGGITLENTGEMLEAGAVAVGVGSSLVRGDAAAIARRAEQLVNVVKVTAIPT